MSLLREDLLGYSGASNLAFNEEIKRRKANGEDIVHFGFGQSPFPVPECLVLKLKEFAHVHDYLSVAGDLELRREICKFHKEQDDIDLDPDNLIVAPGSKSLIYLVMTVFRGNVWIAAPAWTTYMPQAKLAGHTPRIMNQYEENGWKLTPNDIKNGIEGVEGPHLLVLTNPGNPSGCVYSKEELQNLTEVCQSLDVIVLSDEIYARLVFNGEFTCMSKLYPEGTILTSGFSKWVGAGGWRLGYAYFPPQLSELRSAVQSGCSHTHSCAAAPVQFAVAAGLRDCMTELMDYARRARMILGWVSDFCYRTLTNAGVKCQASEAGYYFMPNFECIREGLNKQGVKTGQQMCDYFLQEIGVALMPSSSFLLSEEDLSVRFCFVPFDGAACLKELEKMEATAASIQNGEEFVRANCPEIVKGVEKLANLVKSLL